jgi:hypothetical protein
MNATVRKYAVYGMVGAALPILALATASSAAAQQQQFTDGTFANWTATLAYRTNQNATYTAVQASVGGNDYWRTTHSGYGQANPVGMIYIAHVHNSFSYTPLGLGTRVNVKYRLIHLNAPTTGQSVAVAYAPLIVQDNNRYIGPVSNIFANSWTTFSNTALMAEQFTPIPGQADSIPPYPDFSCGAARMTLGFASINSNNDPNFPMRDSGLDDWEMVFLPPPPPVIPDFDLTATLAGNSPTFTVTATMPFSFLFYTGLFGFYWDVVEIAPNGSQVPGTLALNPPPWWALAAPTYQQATMTHDFAGYNGGANLSTTGGPGRFPAGRTYQISRGVWGPCTPWSVTRKRVMMSH